MPLPRHLRERDHQVCVRCGELVATLPYLVDGRAYTWCRATGWSERCECIGPIRPFGWKRP